MTPTRYPAAGLALFMAAAVLTFGCITVMRSRISAMVGANLPTMIYSLAALYTSAKASALKLLVHSLSIAIISSFVSLEKL